MKECLNCGHISPDSALECVTCGKELNSLSDEEVAETMHCVAGETNPFIITPYDEAVKWVCYILTPVCALVCILFGHSPEKYLVGVISAVMMLYSAILAGHPRWAWEIFKGRLSRHTNTIGMEPFYEWNGKWRKLGYHGMMLFACAAVAVTLFTKGQ